MNNVILIHGKKRSGKDFVSDLIKEELENKGKKVLKFAFADPLKEIICKTFNIDLDSLNDFKNNPEKYPLILTNTKDQVAGVIDFRYILTRFGDDAMKSVFGKNVWVDLAIKKIQDMKDDYDTIIISDLRLPEEYMGIRRNKILNNFNLITIKIDNLNYEEYNHRTEEGLDILWDYEFNNTSNSINLETLETLIEVLLK